MPDITMCSDHECPRAGRCYRSDTVTEPCSWQSWFCVSPRCGSVCEMFSLMDGAVERSRRFQVKHKGEEA